MKKAYFRKREYTIKEQIYEMTYIKAKTRVTAKIIKYQMHRLARGSFNLLKSTISAFLLHTSI